MKMGGIDFLPEYDGKKEDRVLIKISGGRMKDFILLEE